MMCFAEFSEAVQTRLVHIFTHRVLRALESEILDDEIDLRLGTAQTRLILVSESCALVAGTNAAQGDASAREVPLDNPGAEEATSFITTVLLRDWDKT